MAVRELFHVAYWFARTYARVSPPASGLAFDPDALPTHTPIPKQTLEQLKQLEADLRERDVKLTALQADNSRLDEELTHLRAEVAAAKKAAAAQPDTHDYSESETRDYFIDLLLKEAGWLLDQPRDREFEVAGMPSNQNKGFVDYVLWGDDGKPLAVVEAKRTRRDPRAGQQQAKLYADCLENQFHQRPVIFYSNGYDHWLWDDVHYPPREVQGFYKKAELELLIQRRHSRKSLGAVEINQDIVERYYQTRAIRRIAEAFERDHDRKALLVMATGAGKTRTVRMLAENGAGSPVEISRAREVSKGLGLFVRSLVGLDREAAKEALAGFMSGKTPSANQIEFLNLIVNHLTEHGVMEASLLYESPFTDLTPQGPDGLFSSTQVDALMAVLDGIKATAVAA